MVVFFSINLVKTPPRVQGDRLTDLHVWRLGPGHLGAIVAVETSQARGPEFYHEKLSHLPMLSHVTVEVHQAA